MVTKGEWKALTYQVRTELNRLEDRWYVVTPDGTIMAENLSKANTNLIAAAVNACKEINPDNPQAAADSIKAMNEALRDAEQHLIILGCSPDSYARRNIKQALSKAEGKAPH